MAHHTNINLDSGFILTFRNYSDCCYYLLSRLKTISNLVETQKQFNSAANEQTPLVNSSTHVRLSYDIINQDLTIYRTMLYFGASSK